MLAAAAGALVVVAGGVIVVGGLGRERAPRTSQPGASGANAHATSIHVTTQPAGALVRVGGAELGVTPYQILDMVPGRSIEIVLSKPGYAPVKRMATPAVGEPVRVEATLALVSGFEGVWKLPDGGFRQFERRGEQVAGFSLTAAAGQRSFLRMFEFIPSDDSGVAFTAAEPFIDERAPDEPSCNIPLRAEYRYHPADDSLELRKEKAQYTLDGGRCVMQATAWSEPRTLARVSGATADSVWAESRAGGSVPQVDDANAPNAPPTKVAPQKAPPQKKKAPPPPPAQQQEAQQQKPTFKK